MLNKEKTTSSLSVNHTCPFSNDCPSSSIQWFLPFYPEQKVGSLNRMFSIVAYDILSITLSPICLWLRNASGELGVSVSTFPLHEPKLCFLRLEVVSSFLAPLPIIPLSYFMSAHNIRSHPFTLTSLTFWSWLWQKHLRHHRNLPSMLIYLIQVFQLCSQ